jgi:hypothetical protein
VTSLFAYTPKVVLKNNSVFLLAVQKCPCSSLDIRSDLLLFTLFMDQLNMHVEFLNPQVHNIFDSYPTENTFSFHFKNEPIIRL